MEFGFEGQWDLITEFPQDRVTDSWKTQTKPCGHQDPGERRSVPTGDWAILACECSGISSRGVGWQWLALASGALNTTVLGAMASRHVFLKEVGITTITPTIVWPQAKLQGGNTATPISRILDQDLMSLAPPIRARPCFPHSLSLPVEPFQILTMMLLKCSTSIWQQIWKTQ